MSRQKNTNPLFASPIQGDGVGYVALMGFNNAIDKDQSSLFCAIAIICGCLTLMKSHDLVVALFVSLCIAFVILAAAKASKKKEKAEKHSKDVLVAALIQIDEAITQRSRDIVTILAAIPMLIARLVFVARAEWRVAPPKRIYAPTLYPRLASTPWPARA
ncbi:MAG: hypothetical protein AWT59_2458 [Candidatus Gallionella acididurans]|uniref:Uncharacterized protein n=1 Tax=Candidatus Gallionella acididurans TaxID=1796491 RepID=A0A139BQY6_9PROT|nr:MAG: hypothetical protein AWT59_2458 [Candidatus Gallionella acididurans]